jgi:biopolymer transport protein ExbD
MANADQIDLDALGDDDDDFAPPKRAIKDDTEMDITPMIDVTFLLLIFFVVASKMDPQKTVDLPTANNGIAVAQKTSVVLIVARSGDKEAKIYLGDTKDPKNALSGDLAEQEARIQQYVKEGLEEPLKNQVLVMAEKGISYRHVDRVLSAAGGAIEEDQPLNVAIMDSE